jgi:hypothetical protein
MSRTIWDTSGEVDRQWHKRKVPAMGIPGWAGLVIVALGLALAGTLAWQGGKYVLGRLKGTSLSAYAATASGSARGRARVPEWQNDAQAAFRDGVVDSTAANFDGSEMDVDRGAEIISEARERQLTAPPDFFDVAIRTLDQVVQAHPDNDRLIEHTALARIELAQMRSMVPAAVPSDGVAAADASAGSVLEKTVAVETLLPKGPGAAAVTVPVYSPISIPPNSTYDASRVHGNILDATMMADDAEVLLPPASRLMTDGVRVRDVTVKGASQTLDGIYWENVTFIGTRLRYDGGEISLHSVRFINCTFGMPPDERGARLATAIALGQSSVVIE